MGGAPLHKLGPVQRGSWYEVDVTDAVLSMSENGLSLRIHSESNDRAAYSSKEGSEPPQLVLTIGGIEFDDESTATVPAKPQLEPEIDDESTTTVPAKPQREPTTGSVCCSDSNNESFWPLWSYLNEPAECGGRPKWATGAYLKVSRSECCSAFFKLQVDMCLEASL